MADVSAASSVTAAEVAEVEEGKGDAGGKQSLRMKPLTPAEEVDSDRFSLLREQRSALFSH